MTVSVNSATLYADFRFGSVVTSKRQLFRSHGKLVWLTFPHESVHAPSGAMIRGVPGSDSRTVDSISDSPVGGGVITTLLRSADGSRPGLAENSRYSFLRMDEWTAEAGRSLRDQL